MILNKYFGKNQVIPKSFQKSYTPVSEWISWTLNLISSNKGYVNKIEILR